MNVERQNKLKNQMCKLLKERKKKKVDLVPNWGINKLFMLPKRTSCLGQVRPPICQLGSRVDR